MRKLLFALLAIIPLVIIASGGIKEFSQDTLRFGSSNLGNRSIIFDYAPDGSSASIVVNPANDEFTFNNLVNMGGALEMVGPFQIGTGTVNSSSLLDIFSTTKGSQPCPTMTATQRDAIATPATGLCVYVSDFSSYYQYDGATWSELGGGGGGGLDVFFLDDFEKTVAADFSKDSDATFLGTTGTFDGVLSDETTSPIAGLSSIKWVGNATAGSNDNDWIALPAITLDDKQKGQDVGVNFYYTWDGTDDYMALRVFCTAPTSYALSSDLDTLLAESNPTRYSTSVFIPASCNAIRVGFHCLTGEVSKTLVFDDLEVSTNPFVYKNLVSSPDTVTKVLTSNQTSAATMTDLSFSGLEVGKEYEVNGTIRLVAQSGASDHTVEVHAYHDGNVINKTNLSDYTASVTNIVTSGIAFKFIATTTTLTFDAVSASANSFVGGNNSRDTTYIQLSKVINTTEHVVTPMKVPSQESLTVTGTNWTTDRAEGIYYTTGDGAHRLKFNIRGSISSTATSFVGTISGVTFSNSYGDGQALASNLLEFGVGNRTVQISKADSGVATFTVSSGSNFDIIRVSGDVELASKPTWANPVSSQYLAAAPVREIVYIKDLKSSGSNGGSSSANTIQTRDLNSITGDFGSLSSNQFTLQRGEYDIEASAPAYKTDGHQIFLYNVSDTSYDIDGMAMSSFSSDNTFNLATLTGKIIITEAKTFEIRHWTESAQSLDGLGNGADGTNNPQTSEVFTTVKITKIR